MRGTLATRAAWLTLFAPLCWLILNGCREVEGPETQVMLRVHCQDRALISAMTSLRVHFALQEDEPWGWHSYPSSDFAKGTLYWPVDIPIVPGDPEDERKRFEVVVEAMDGQRVLAQQRAVTGFVAGGLRLLEVWLYTCPGEDALHCLQPGCEHDGCAVCQLDGNCGSSVIARERLPAFDVAESPVSRPPFDTTGAPSGAMAPGGTGAGAGAQPGTGGSTGMASPSGGSPAGVLGMPGGADASDAGVMPPRMTPDAGVGAGAGGGGGDSGSSGSGSADAGGSIGATVPDAGVRDAGAGTAGGTTGGATGGSVGGVDAGMRDAGPQDAGIDSTVPREAGIPEGGTIGGLGGGAIEAGSIGGSFGGGPGATTAFSLDESEFGPGSYSGW